MPELASRSHMRSIIPVIERALDSAGVTLDDIDAVAATCGPGLVGSLLVGLSAAKAIAFARELPFVGVNHLEGHLLSVRLDADVPFPYVALLVSGGHTSLYYAAGLRPLSPARHDARRRRRRGLRQGRAGASASAFRAAGSSTSWRARATPTAIRFPRARLKPRRGTRTAMRRAVRVQLQRPQDRGVAVRARPRGRQRAGARRRRRELPGSRRRHAARQQLRGGAARRAAAVWSSPAACRPTRACAQRAHAAGAEFGVTRAHPAAALLHRQRGDDRAGGRSIACARGESDPLSLNAAADLEL